MVAAAESVKVMELDVAVLVESDDQCERSDDA